MAVTRNIFYREAKALAVFIALGTVQTFFMCFSCQPRVFLIVLVFTVLLWLLLWRGNNGITCFLDERISWITYPGKRFLAGVFATAAYTLAVVFATMYVFQVLLSFRFGSSNALPIQAALVITFVVTLFTHSKQFLGSWRKATLERERFAREMVTASYEQLKTRINPRLLFDSLHSLRHLVVENKDEAVKFIKHLSDVYRYILETRDRELVESAKELRFLQSFVFLLQVRFRDAIGITLNWEGTFYITPLAIQLITEAVLENNVPDNHRPMTVTIESAPDTVKLEIFSTENDLVISTELREILQNLEERYKVLSAHSPVIGIEARQLTIRLPWLREQNKRWV